MSKWLTEEEEADLSKKERKTLKADRKEAGITAEMAMEETTADILEEAVLQEPEEESHVKVDGDVWAGNIPSAVEEDESDEASVVREHATVVLDLCQQITKDMSECLDNSKNAVAMRKMTIRLGQVGKDFRTATIDWKKSQ